MAMPAIAPAERLGAVAATGIAVVELEVEGRIEDTEDDKDCIEVINDEVWGDKVTFIVEVNTSGGPTEEGGAFVDVN